VRARKNVRAARCRQLIRKSAPSRNSRRPQPVAHRWRPIPPASREIANNEHKQRVAEAEIEIKSGSPRFLFELARRAIERCDAPPSFVDTALRGRRLDRGAVEDPESALDLDLQSGTTTISAFQQIVGACLQQASINEEILRHRPGHVEATHQLRVAIRRLRAPR
jgi:inorganic triphosphatase YgiF